MQTPAIHVSKLPPFSNMRARCAQCDARGGAWVIFDHGCRQVIGGEHFHRRCGRCSHEWIEQASEGAAPSAVKA